MHPYVECAPIHENHQEAESLERTWWKHPPRIQGFEFCDQAFLNGVWREAYMDGLSFLMRAGGTYRRMHEPLAAWAKRAGHSRVLDLASGGAGPIATMLDAAERDGTRLPHFTLSDLHPDLAAFRDMETKHKDKISFFEKSFDALNDQKVQPGIPLRSSCAGFHHFTPQQLRKLLEQATAQSDGLFIMEPMPCSWWSVLMSLPCLLVLMLTPFFAARFSWKKLFITTLMPLIPLMIVWDGTISALRMYRPEEILALLPASARNGWKWTWGSQRYLGIYQATYFCGYRVRDRDAA